MGNGSILIIGGRREKRISIEQLEYASMKILTHMMNNVGIVSEEIKDIFQIWF